MLAGYPPFYDDNPYEIYRKISIGYYEFPPTISLNARKLIDALLNPDNAKRLGCMIVSLYLYIIADHNLIYREEHKTLRIMSGSRV